MFQCAEHQIKCLDQLLSLGYVHPFETAVDEGVVLKGMFRAPLAHWMRIAPLAAAVTDQLTRESWSITKNSADVTAIVGVTNIIHQRSTASLTPMSLWMHWWNAIWRLRPAFSRLQTFLWFATAVAIPACGRTCWA